MDHEIAGFTRAIGAKRIEGRLRSLFRRANYFSHKKGFLIVKISRIENPFWGIGKKYIDFLNDLMLPYFVILLESETSGYLFTKHDVMTHVENRTWRVASDGQYKIISPPRRNAFLNVEQFLDKL